jgi:hypothetical protein
MYLNGIANPDRFSVELLNLMRASTSHTLLGSLAFLVLTNQQQAVRPIWGVAEGYISRQHTRFRFWKTQIDRHSDEMDFNSEFSPYDGWETP